SIPDANRPIGCRKGVDVVAGERDERVFLSRGYRVLDPFSIECRRLAFPGIEVHDDIEIASMSRNIGLALDIHLEWIALLRALTVIGRDAADLRGLVALRIIGD